MTDPISIQVVAVPNQGLPTFSGQFERINIILGANGSGKTKLMQHLVQNAERIFGTAYTPVSIEGGRAIPIPDALAITNQNMGIYSDPLKARQDYRQNRRATLTSRINRTFVMMRALENYEKAAHSDAVCKWKDEGRQGQLPERPTPPLTRLAELFSGIFPHLSIQIASEQLRVIKSGAPPYPVSQMSEGEKQVFTLLAEIAVLTNERSVFFVDEPELNLHPILAEKVWASIEDAYPNDIFVYATHSLSFAMRSSVNAVFAIGHGKIDRSQVSNNLLDLRPFLGSIPGIVKAQRCLFVEGDELSFDAPFYQWILGTRDIEVCPVGPSSEVIAAATRDGVWKQIAAGIHVKGVIDRDFKTDTGIRNVVVLSMHEAESFLCHPTVILEIQRILANQERTYTADEILERITTQARTRLAFVVAQRVFQRTSINLRLSIERSGVARIDSIEALRPLLLEAAHSEAEKARSVFEVARLNEAIEQEQNRCSTAIENRNLDELLILFEGKRLLPELCRMAGCATPLGLLHAVTKHLNPSNFPHTKSLQENLNDLLT